MDYIKAKNRIKKLILEEGYVIGDKIPSINKLANHFGVGKISVQNAVKQLEEEGVLENIPRSGCYVKHTPEEGVSQTGGDATFGSMFTSSFMRDPRKKIRIGVLADLSVFSHLWKKIFLEYMKDHGDINVELVPLEGLQGLCANRLEEEVDIFQIPISYLCHFVEREALFDLSKIGGPVLLEKDFYKGIIEGVEHDGKPWGVPLVCATTCFFSNKEYNSFIAEMKPEDGFWAFLENASSSAARKWPVAALDINLSLYDLVKLTLKRREFDFKKVKDFKDGAFDELVKKLEPYFRDKKVIAPFFSTGASVHESSTNNFFGCKSASSLGCFSSIVNYLSRVPFELNIQPLPVEKTGSCNVESALNVISSRSRYPVECFEILKYLASFEVQSYFAREGRLTAHKKANEHLCIKGLDEKSHQNLVGSMERGIVEKGNGIDIAEFTHTIAFYEMKYWQRGDFDADELLRRLKQKAHFFFENKKINIIDNKNTEKVI